MVTNTDLKVDCLTTDELKKLWNQGSEVKSLSEVNPKLPFPSSACSARAPTPGTFDFFTDVINGEEGVSREDYSPSEDDNVLVQGRGRAGRGSATSATRTKQNKDRLNLVKVDGGDGCVEPTTETIQSGEYKPLSVPCSCIRASRR